MMPGQQPPAGGMAPPQGGPAPEQAGGMPTQGNPVIEAFQTITSYIAALSEQGDPAAPELQNLMGQFIEVLRNTIGKGSGMVPPQGGEPPTPPAAGPAPMSRAQAHGGGTGVDPMLGNMAGSRAMKGQVAVI
jgi:hypothetical protein